MEPTKLIVLLSYTIIATSLAVLLTNLLIWKVKQKSMDKGDVSVSFGVWYSAQLATLGVLLHTAFGRLISAMDLMLVSVDENAWMRLVKLFSVHLGTALVVFVIWYYVIGLLSTLIWGSRRDVIEAERNNYTYFLVKGILQFVSVWLLVSPLETVLRWIGPVVEPVFY